MRQARREKSQAEQKHHGRDLTFVWTKVRAFTSATISSRRKGATSSSLYPPNQKSKQTERERENKHEECNLEREGRNDPPASIDRVGTVPYIHTLPHDIRIRKANRYVIKTDLPHPLETGERDRDREKERNNKKGNAQDLRLTFESRVVIVSLLTPWATSCHHHQRRRRQERPTKHHPKRNTRACPRKTAIADMKRERRVTL